MKKYDDSQTIWSVTIIDNLSSHFFIQRGGPWKKNFLVIFRKKNFFMCYNYMAHSRYHLCHRWMKIGQSEKVLGVKGKMTHFTPLSAYSFNIFQQNSVQKCMTIMCIIVTEEVLGKKQPGNLGKFCQKIGLPLKWWGLPGRKFIKKSKFYHICP